MPHVNKDWFEMRDLRRPRLSTATWIPLRFLETTRSQRKWIAMGGWEEHFQVIAIELPLAAQQSVPGLDWVVAQCSIHEPSVQNEGWVRAGTFRDERFGDFSGRYPVLVSSTCGETEWLLDQDVVLALGLIREGESWVRPKEDFLDVARLERAPDSESLKIRAEHFRDYLGARESGLVLATYRSRKAVFAQKPDFGWGSDDEPFEGGGRWNGGYHEVTAGGFPLGPVSVMKMSRHDPELGDDVPILPGAGDENVRLEKGTYRPQGTPLTIVRAELWRNEWVPPSRRSPMVRGDEVESTVDFIVDGDGTRARAQELRGGIRWLWFSPLVVGDILERRGGELSWATENTGGIRLVSYSPLHFGVSGAGLVNVFAKDIALLPEHAQRLWTARNVTPDGRVSEELLAAQMRCDPAATHAPEVELVSGRTEAQIHFRDATRRGALGFAFPRDRANSTHPPV